MTLVLDKCLLTAAVHITFVSQNVTSSVPCSFWYQIKTSHYCKFRPLQSCSGKFMASLFCFPLNIHCGGCAEQLCGLPLLPPKKGQNSNSSASMPRVGMFLVATPALSEMIKNRHHSFTNLKESKNKKRFLTPVIEDIRYIKSEFFMIWRHTDQAVPVPVIH